MGWEQLIAQLRKYITKLRKDVNTNLSILWSYFTAVLYDTLILPLNTSNITSVDGLSRAWATTIQK